MRAEHFKAIEVGVSELINRIAEESGESRWYLARLVELEAEDITAAEFKQWREGQTR